MVVLRHGRHADMRLQYSSYSAAWQTRSTLPSHACTQVRRNVEHEHLCISCVLAVQWDQISQLCEEVKHLNASTFHTVTPSATAMYPLPTTPAYAQPAPAVHIPASPAAHILAMPAAHILVTLVAHHPPLPTLERYAGGPE